MGIGSEDVSSEVFVCFRLVLSVYNFADQAAIVGGVCLGIVVILSVADGLRPFGFQRVGLELAAGCLAGIGIGLLAPAVACFANIANSGDTLGFG